jgi:hypothetical protein
MAWSTDQIFQFQQFLTRKNQSNSISPNDYFYAWNAQGASYMQDMLGRFQRNSTTKEGLRTGAIENATIKSKLAPFTKNVTIPVTAGLAPKPSDFTYAWALRETTSQQRIWPANHDQLWSIMESVINPPSISENSYYFTEYGLNYSILPEATASIDLDYCTGHLDLVWGYTVDGNGRFAYDPATSVQPLWSQSSIVEISQRTLKLFGVSYHDNDMSQFGESIIDKGN